MHVFEIVIRRNRFKQQLAEVNEADRALKDMATERTAFDDYARASPIGADVGITRTLLTRIKKTLRKEIRDMEQQIEDSDYGKIEVPDSEDGDNA